VEEGRRGLLSGATGMSRFLVCEDGGEYTGRFTRFLSGEFEFVRAACFAQALPLLPSCSGLLLDLDFRRTAPALLVDESGSPAPASSAEIQGILILRALRKSGWRMPVLLFADFDDPGRAARLEAELSPLQVIASSEGLPAIAALLRKMSANQERDRQG
jgi:hypothetical protein